jgi:hypothetical protein
VSYRCYAHFCNAQHVCLHSFYVPPSSRRAHLTYLSAPVQNSPMSPKYSPTSPASPSSPKYCTYRIIVIGREHLHIFDSQPLHLHNILLHVSFHQLLLSLTFLTNRPSHIAPAYCKIFILLYRQHYTKHILQHPRHQRIVRISPLLSMNWCSLAIPRPHVTLMVSIQSSSPNTGPSA